MATAGVDGIDVDHELRGRDRTDAARVPNTDETPAVIDIAP